jgi:hypothetical protein
MNDTGLKISQSRLCYYDVLVREIIFSQVSVYFVEAVAKA